MTKQNLNSDTRFYEEQLSPFGNQVLKELIKNWSTDRDFAKTVLCCRGPPRPRRRHQLAARHEVSLALPATRNKMSPTSTTPSYLPSESQFVVNRPQVISTELQREVDDSNQFLPRDYASYEALPPSESHRTNNKRKYSSNDLIIGWNDMFDKELLGDVLPPPAPSSPLHPSASVSLELPIPFPQVTFNKDAMCSGASTESIVCDTETTKAATKNSLKRKSIQPTIDAAIKKIKIQAKQKYTTTVKNWLADVDSTRPFEEETAEAVGGNTFATHVGETKNAVKVIQSRLANKGGVMKFGILKNEGRYRKIKKRDKERFLREQAPAPTAKPQL